MFIKAQPDRIFLCLGFLWGKVQAVKEEEAYICSVDFNIKDVTAFTSY